MGWSLSDTLCLNILIFFLVPLVYAAPLSEISTDNLGYYPVSDKTGCYYNFQHYDEGDRIFTNEPCLNCTCHNKMLMCYLRVCPFVKAYGENCRVEKRADLCCPIITCPEVPVPLIPSNASQNSEDTALGRPDNYGCTIDNLFYADGVRIPGDPNKPCELCYCIRNKTACVMQECTLKIQGCTPVYHKDICCPIRYNCDDRPALEGPADPEGGLIFTTSTTTTTTTTTTVPTTTVAMNGCVYNDGLYGDGERIDEYNEKKPCETCYCMKGHIVCAVQECAPTPLEKINCTALPPVEGECCPSQYECDNMSGELPTSTELYELSTVKEINGVTSTPIGATSQSSDDQVTSTESGQSIDESVSSSSEETEPEKLTTARIAPVDTSTEIHTESDQSSTEASGIPEDKISTSEHDEEQHPTIPSESQVTTSEPEKIQTELTPEKATSIDIKEGGVTTYTQAAIIEHHTEEVSHENIPSEEVSSDDHGEELSEEVTTKKNHVLITTEIPTTSQVNDFSPSESTGTQTEDGKITTSNEDQQTSSESSGVTNHKTDNSETVSPQVTTEWMKPQESSEAVSSEAPTFVPNTQDASENVPSESTTKAQLEDNSIQTTVSQTEGETVKESTELPQIQNHISNSDEESDKPETTAQEESSSTTPNISTEKAIDAGNQQSEEKLVTANPTETEKATDVEQENTEGAEKIPENISTEAPLTQETTIKDENSIDKAGHDAENVSEDTEKDNTIADITTEKEIKDEQTTVPISLVEQSKESTTMESPRVTDNASNDDEVSISTTPKNIETQNSETTVGTNPLPENSSDETLTKGEENISTESVQPLEHEISASSESSLSNTSDETTTPSKSGTDAEAEPGISSTEGISGSDEKSGETISEQGAKHDSDKPQELPTTEASKDSDEKITTEIPEETTGAKLTESTVEGHISSTEAIKESDPEKSGPSESSSQSQETVEIYDASTTPESEIVNENGPENSSTEIPDSYISPVSGQQTTNASPEPTEATERVTEHTLSTEKSEITTQSGQVTNAPTEISSQVSEASAQTQETKTPSTSAPHEDLAPTTTEQAASNSETTERLVPGEGSCLVDGVTYENYAHIDPINQCQVSCKCFNSIVKCESVTCDPPSADLGNCMAVYPGPDSCCPIYNCATPGDQSMESGSQKKENENQKPAVTESYIPNSTDSDIVATTINTVEEGDKKDISPNETPVTNTDVNSSGPKESDSISNESSTLPTKEYEPSSPSTDIGADSSSESDKEITEITTESNRKEESAEENTEDKKVTDNKATESSTASNADTSEEVTIYLGGVPSTESPDFDKDSSTSPKQESSSDDDTITETNKTEPSREPELTTEKEISPTTSSKDQYSKPSESVESSSTESIEQDPSSTGITPSEHSDNKQDNLLTTQSSISEKEHEELGNKPFTSAPKLDSTPTPQHVTGEEIISVSTTEKVIHSDEIPENTNQSTEKLLENDQKEETTSHAEETEPFTSKPSSETPPQEITEPNEKLSEADSTTKSAEITSSERTPQDIITSEKQLSEGQSPFTSSAIDSERVTTEKAPIEEVKEPFTSKPSTEQIAVQPDATTQSSEKQDEPIDEVSHDFGEGEENVEPTSPEKSPEKEIPESSSVTSSSEGSNVGVTEKSEIGEKQDETAPSEEETTEPEHVTIADDSKPEMPDNDNLVTEVPIIPSSQESHETSTEQVHREPEINTSQVNVASEETTKAVEVNEATQKSVKPHESSSQVFDLTTKIETTSIATSNEDSKDVSTEKQIVVEKEISTESVPSVEKVPEVTEKNIVGESTESTVSSEKEPGLSTSVENEITTVGTKEISTATDNISNPTTVSSIVSGVNTAEPENTQTTEKSIESTEPSQSTVVGSQENDQSSPFTDKIPVEDISVTTASPKDISSLQEIITEATEKSSESSEKSPESTEKSSESTEKSSESTEKSSESTEKSSESDEKSSESTEKSSQPAEESPSGETNSQTIQPTEEETTKSVIHDASDKPTESSETTSDKMTEGIEETNIHLTEGPALVDKETIQVTTQKSVESVVSTEQETTPHSIIDSTNQSTEASSITKEEGATTPKSLETTSIVESSEKETTSEISEALPTKIDEGKQTTTQKSIGSTESYEEDKTEISPIEEVHHSTTTPEQGTTELLKQGDEYSTTQKSPEVTESGYTLGEISTASGLGEINPSSSKPTEQNPTGQALEQEDGLQTTAKFSESEDTSANEATTLSYDEKIHASTEAPKQIPNESDSSQEDNGLSTPKSVDSSGTTSSKSESTTQYSAETPKQGQESTESITEQAPTEKSSGIETYSTDSPKYEPTVSSVTEEELKQTTQKIMEPSEPSEEEKGEPHDNSTESIKVESTESVGSSKTTSEPILEELSTPKSTSAPSSELPGSEEEATQKTFESTEGEKEVESDKTTTSSVSEITTLPSFSDGGSTSSTEKSDSVPSESSAIADESTTEGVLKPETEKSISSDTSTESVQPVETESLKPESQEPVESPIKPDTSSTLGEEISSTVPPKEYGEKEEDSSTPNVEPSEISTSPESIHDESTPKAEITSESSVPTDQKESVPELSTTSKADDMISPESSTELSKQETTLESDSKFSDESSKSTEGIPAVTQAVTLPISGVEYETTPPSSPEILESAGTTDVNKIEQEISTAKSDVLLGEKDKNVSPIGESASSTETPGMDESSPTTASSVDKESDQTVDTLSGDNGDKLTTIKVSETEPSANNESQEKGTTMQYSPAVSTEKTIIEKESENVTPTKDTEKVSEPTTELSKKPSDNEITTSKDFSEADTQRPTTLSHFIPTVSTTTTIQPEKLPSLPDYSEPDYTEESGDEFGPGTCRYGGKVYVSAQQIPRDDPCDFCFCFRSDIICLQQSCPPPIRNCHQEPIRGFCCPRYECPVNMAVSMNLTTTTTTTTTTLPPHFLSHAYKGKAVKAGCLIKGQAYQVGDPIPSASGPCLQCKCGGHGQMECNPVVCSPSPMLEQMLNVAATSKRRR